ncbi:MAG: hypothetical protein FJ012_11340 [Chloroflexi bacterium]|nr:hypothetical protein [Chloroflexota bacterium]
MTTVKLTISLPSNLVSLADEVAREKRISRSKVVSSCLEELARKRFEEQMAEGYKAMADEHSEFARLTQDIAHEVIPEWK